MNDFLVVKQICIACISLSAHVALIRFFPSVRVHVHFKQRWHRKSFVAHLTIVPLQVMVFDFLSLDAQVNSLLVTPPIGPAMKGHFALITLVGFGPCMIVFVNLKQTG